MSISAEAPIEVTFSFRTLEDADCKDMSTCVYMCLLYQRDVTFDNPRRLLRGCTIKASNQVFKGCWDYTFESIASFAR